jgi:hypothetical protein
MTEKVSFYADEKAWEKFKNQVYRSSGTTRTLSTELNKLLEDRTLIKLETQLRELMPTQEKTAFTLEEIKRNRPTPPEKSEELIQKMRSRNAGISG